MPRWSVCRLIRASSPPKPTGKVVGPPSCHGVDRGQLDPSAAVIRLLERLGWVHDVRWPTPDRVASRRA
ncbi:hypothetical protein GCM10017771_97190 [Streptomyces capitiformicae]|uniref:Uncharacterized protein n=1 Tax=Streptomyces capitiformicae TaxID=2014920 RepID=A0A919DT05_9ACTN|nr:hypothetical protein GCM10017771_97190 [Streptomyces capitiformicae]